MKIFEVVDPNGLGYYDVNSDKINSRSRSDTRKDKLYLRDINKLKQLRALKKLNALKQQDVLEIMYGDDGGDDMGGPAF